MTNHWLTLYLNVCSCKILSTNIGIKTTSYWHHVRRFNSRLTSGWRTWCQYDVVLMLTMVVSRILEQLYHQMLLHGVHRSSVLAEFLLTLFIFRQSWVVDDIQTEISQFPQAHIWCLYALYTVISWSILIEITNYAYEIYWYYY